MRFPCAVLISACALMLVPLLAQSPNGALNGLVVDPSSRTIGGADIVAVNDATGIKYTTKTNDEGIYVLPNLPPGPYRLQVSKMGFKTLIKPDITLNVQDALSVNFTLPIGALAETITVEGGAPLVNTESAAVSTVVDRQFVEHIPLNGRSFQDLISLTPGVVTQSPQNQTLGQAVAAGGDFSVNGQRTESNYYTVDGVAANVSGGTGDGQYGPADSGSLGSVTALGTTQSLVSVDALQEFRVQSSTYSAEFGRAPGGQFSLVTRSGSNELHGTVFDYFRNDFFDANDWFNDKFGKPISALRQNDFGGTLGGPVSIPSLYNGRDKTFFFLSYEGLRLTQPLAASILYVPDVFMRQQAPAALQAILNAFPVQNGADYGSAATPSLAQFIGTYSLPSQVDSTSIRVDHTFNHKLTLFFRYGNTPSSTASRNLSDLTHTHLNTESYTLGATSQLSGKANNEFRLGYSRGDSSQIIGLDRFGGAEGIDLADAMGAGTSASAEPVVLLRFSGIGSTRLQTTDTGNHNQQWNLVDTITISAGKHQVTTGVDFRRIATSAVPPSPVVEGSFSTSAQVLSNSPSFLYISYLLRYSARFNEIAAFLQDEWRIMPRLSLSLGLRWEADPPPSEPTGDSFYTLQGSLSNPSSWAVAPRGTRLWKTPWYNFAPRLGVAWTARKTSGSETVLRTGGGVFFDSDNQQATLPSQGVGFAEYQFPANAAIPATPAQLDFAPSAAPPYSNTTISAYPTHLQLPYTLEWNASIEQALGRAQSVSVSYLGASGRRLIGLQEFYPPSGAFGAIYYFSSGITSNYQALQVKCQRSASHGVHALASYTWSHSIDVGSSSAALPLTRGNSDFDVRHNFQGGLSWELPSIRGSAIAKAIASQWGVDSRLIARTGFPVTLQGNYLTDPITGNSYFGNVDIVPEQPLYLYGSQYPGGRAINPAAFGYPNGNGAGNAPRNFVRGFGAWQINLAIRREFPIRNRLRLEFRAETFNILNHPNFGYIDPALTDATFGQATQMLNQSLGTVASQYQQGGPRSMQFALKLRF